MSHDTAFSPHPWFRAPTQRNGVWALSLDDGDFVAVRIVVGAACRVGSGRLVIMDSVISHIASRSGNQSDLKQLRSYLMKHQQHIQSAGSQLDSALGMIDAKKQSLGFTYLLYALVALPS